MGNGRVHKNLLPVLTEAAGRGVAVVCSTRVGGGIVALDAELEGRGFIAAGDLNPQKARVLLQLALTGNPGPEELRGVFARC
jgi:L-asparaginase